MVTAVLGLQWGDEGKGKIVDALCEEADVAVRCQGGANAGHTVVIEGTKHVLHLIPSGILRANTYCVIADGVVVDLDVLSEEINRLRSLGLEVLDRLAVSMRAHVVLPLHRRIEAIHEEARGKERIGTTGRGIGPCYSDKAARLGIRICDVLQRDSLAGKIKALYEAHGFNGTQADEEIERTLGYLSRFADLMRRVGKDTHVILAEALASGKSILLEGSQGFMLDLDHGTYPYVTSCNTGIHGLLTGSGLPPGALTKVVGVAKAYVTRVGAGPFPTQMEEPFQSQVRERGQEFGATTGRPRRCGWLDLVALRYACRTNGITSLAITKLDTLGGIEILKVCTAYKYGGKIFDVPPPSAGILSHCIPQYKQVDPWRDLGTLSCFDDLPREAKAYLALIEEWTDSRVEVVSTGAERASILRA